MNEKLGRTGGPVAVENDEAEVAALLREAGPRAGLESGESKAIEAAARAEWSRLVARQRERRRFVARRATLWLGATAAALGALAFGLRLRERPAPPPALPTATLAAVELVGGEVTRVDARGVRGPLVVGGTLRADDALETGAGGRLALRFAAGASLRVDVDSRVRLVAANRVALERGALYVDSGSQVGGVGRIEVETPFARVVEIGTRFEVRLIEAGETPPRIEEVRVRVREGEVELRHDRPARARAGEELGLGRDGSVRVAAVAPYGDAWSWVLAAAPGFAIEGRSFAEFLGWIERETGWEVELAPHDLAVAAASIRLHGSIAGLSPEEAVGVVVSGSGLVYRLDGGRLTVSRPAPR